MKLLIILSMVMAVLWGIGHFIPEAWAGWLADFSERAGHPKLAEILRNRGVP